MAKGNMLLGFARNKLGDLVFSRSDGQQVIRARNRAPKNPNSDKQLVQRAIMANVMQLYSVGQSIFNHSFQGKAVGAQNQREFIRINTNKLRGLVVGDLNSAATPENCAGRVGARGINVAVPFVGMQISKGTYQQSLFTEDNGVFKMPAPVADETVAAYAQRVGLIAEDIYTFVGIAVNYSEVVANLNVEEESASGNLDRMYNSRFEYVQLKVKNGLSAITDTITSATLISTIFDLYSYSGEPLTDLTINDGISLPDFISWQDGGAIGCIRSREFEDLRSSSYMIASTGSYNWGFASAYLLDVWNAGTTLQGTDLILEGSNFSQAGGSAAPTLPDVNTLTNGFYYVPDRLAYGTGSSDWEIGAIVNVNRNMPEVCVCFFYEAGVTNESPIIFEDDEIKIGSELDLTGRDMFLSSFEEWMSEHYQNSEGYDISYSLYSSLDSITSVIGSL